MMTKPNYAVMLVGLISIVLAIVVVKHFRLIPFVGIATFCVVVLVRVTRLQPKK